MIEGERMKKWTQKKEEEEEKGMVRSEGRGEEGDDVGCEGKYEGVIAE